MSFSLLIPQMINAQEFDGISIQLSITPDIIESEKNTYPIGYVSLIQSNGEPINSPDDIEIKLKSSSPSVSVPNSVHIKQNQNNVSFDVTVIEEVNEEVEITAEFNDQTVSQKLRIGEKSVNFDFIPELVINLASENAHVNSQVPFSIFLRTSDDTIIQAPKDITINLEYDDKLIKPENDKITIKKGEFYAISYFRTFENAGRAFLKANIPEINVNSVSSLKISSTDPDNLKLYVYPEWIPENTQSDFEIFVGLYDSNGDPAIATENVNLSIVANKGEFLADMLDDLWKESKPIIRKGSFGYHAHVDTDFVFSPNVFNYTLTASSNNYGTSSQMIQIMEQLSENDPKAALKEMKIFVPDKLPSQATAIMTYQSSAIEVDEDAEDDDPVLQDFTRGEDTIRNIDQLDAGELYPLPIEKFYQTRESSANLNVDNLRVTTTDESIVKILEPGVVKDKRSFGTAIIATGQKTGEVTLSATLKGLSTGSAKTTVVNPVMATETKIFSPFGEDKIIFDNNGFTDLMFVLLDASERPTTLTNGIQYVIKPVNQLIDIGVKETFTVLPIHISSFGASSISENDILNDAGISTGQTILQTTFDATPVGIEDEEELQKTTVFEVEPSPTTLQIRFPINTILSNGTTFTQPLASLQLIDIFGNPVTVMRNLPVDLQTSDSSIVQIPRHITIPEGSSFTNIPITVTGNEGISTLMANATGIKFGSVEQINVKQTLPELSIFTPPNEKMVINQSYPLEFFIDDEFGNTIVGAGMSFEAEDAIVDPDYAESDSSGRIEVEFTPTGPNASLTAIAFKDNYQDDEETMVFDISEEIVEEQTDTIFGLPPWILYVAVAGVIAGIAGVVVVILRKPKTAEEEEEDMEI